MSDKKHDVAVVGAGVIGLAVAWRARLAGASVLLLERAEPGSGASQAAAGMIAPVSEAQAGERELLSLALESAAAWPGFASELESQSGIEVGLLHCGTLMVARDRDGAEAVDREINLRRRFGLDVQRLLPSAARSLEPALAPTIRLAASLPTDLVLEPRRLIRALIEACKVAGVEIRTGVAVEDPLSIPADRVVVACGAWSPSPVRPVKGQALALRDPAGPGLCSRVVRFEGGYLVPRGDGRYYLGATMEEQGANVVPTALAVYELLRDCSEVLPGVLELELDELIVGLRPGTPDNAPIIGAAASDDRVVWATGHHRHGILLCPVTAELVVSELIGMPREHPFGPERFAAVVA